MRSPVLGGRWLLRWLARLGRVGRQWDGAFLGHIWRRWHEALLALLRHG